MAIVGLNFTKILIEKTQPVKGKVNINNNVGIKEVKKTNFSLGASNQNGLRFIFEFTSKYEPSLGSIFISGEVIFVGDEKDVESIFSEWEKSKTIPKPVLGNVLNTILNKCNVQALILSQTMNLPSPIPLPKVADDAVNVNSKNDVKEVKKE